MTKEDAKSLLKEQITKMQLDPMDKDGWTSIVLQALDLGMELGKRGAEEVAMASDPGFIEQDLY